MEISHDQAFDFLILTEGETYIVPCLRRFFYNFDLFIYTNENVRLSLEIHALGYKAKSHKHLKCFGTVNGQIT